MRVVFLGNHTVGVTALSVLEQCAEIVGVIAHPEDPEDGVCYQSVYEYANSRSFPVIRGKATEPGVADFIALTKPDLIWITDYRYLLPAELLSIATLGTINLHPSLLPRYRGRAPINWAILYGETKLGLTAHFVDEGMDSGDIIMQESFELSINEDVGDALRKLLPLYASITRRILNDLQSGNIVRQKQNTADATCYPARKPSDGQIDWDKNASVILNMVRAVAPPYPGAFSFLGNKKIIIKKANLSQSIRSANAGSVIGFEQGAPIVACGEGVLVLREIESVDGGHCPIDVGDVFRIKDS